MLEASHISYAIKGKWLVHDFSLCVDEGDFVALVGPNGAGKTTALRMLCGELSPTEGVVRYRGTELRQHGARALAKERACFEQVSAGNFPFTVREIATLGRQPHLTGMYEGANDLRVVDAAMQEAGVEQFAARLYPTLSGGEATRTQLARVLAQEPRLLLLDEPTNHLDIHFQQDVLALCKRLAREGCAVVAVLHDLNLASYFADRIVVLKDGCTVSDGVPSDVLTVSMLETVYGLQCDVWRHPSGCPWVVPLLSKTETTSMHAECGGI